LVTHGVDDPGGTVPGGGVDSSPEVEEEDSGNTTTIQVRARVVFGLDDTNVGTDDPHTDRAGDTTDKEKVSASELINKEQKPHERHDSLDNTEDTGHKVDSVGVDTDLGIAVSIAEESKRVKCIHTDLKIVGE
jgi:hypothetical protein